MHRLESATDSLDLMTAPALHKADAGVNGLSGVKKVELMGLAREHLSPAQLEDATSGRSYKLTAAGWALLDAHPEVVAKHQKKLKIYWRFSTLD